jgi:hypothetical protein
MRYPSFMPPDPEWAEQPDHVDDEGPSITIMYIADEDVWQAVWGDRQQLGEFQGTRDEAITWARERCETIRIYSLSEQDIVDLRPDEQ